MMNGSSSKGLVNELVKGRDLTRELQLVLRKEPCFASNEACGLMAKNILAQFESSLQILHYDPTNQIQFQVTADSPNSNGSLKSSDSDSEFKDQAEHKENFKKRRLSPRITQRVQGSTSSGLEGPIEDGYSWRKYGQKDIHSADYPRAYYRCTHRVSHGCLATKQVQRSDDDPSSFDVTYRCKHTCSQALSSSSSSSYPNHNTPKLETLFYSPQHKNIWDFKTDNTKHIKPIMITTNNNSIINHKCSSFSSNSLLDLSANNNNFVGNCNYPTNSRSYAQDYQQSPAQSLTKNGFNDHQNSKNDGAFLLLQLQEVVPPSSTNSPTIAPELSSCDLQGEFDDVFINLENSDFFQY